jgi:hypothetical protein
MRTPSWLVIVPLFVVVWLMAMLASGWPGSVAWATDGERTWDAGHAVVLNAQDNGDNEEGSSDNSDNAESDNGDNGESDNNNDNREDVNVVPVPVPVPASAPAPAPSGPAASSGVDQVSQCLANGGVLVYQGPEGGIAVKSFQDNLSITLARVDPASQPPPPGSILSTYIFRMTASPCGGAPYSVLPSEVNLAVSYTDALAAGRDETRFALMFYDGVGWTVAPKLVRDAANNHVSASVTGLGVYALVQQ